MIQIGLVTADIRFDAGTLERIFADPRAALADPEAFWEAEEPMRYAKGWHIAVDVPIDWDHFRTVVGAIADLSPLERSNHPALLTARRVMEQEERFEADGLEHLCSLLPDNPAVLDIRILFTGGIRANAFAWEHVVVDATSTFWHRHTLTVDEKASWILNMLVHECWHGGYSENRDQRSEAPPEDRALYRLLDNIQNEGIATYVNYTAQPIFPAVADSDFRMLDDPGQVAAKFASMVGILKKRRTLDEGELRRLVWEEGVLGRAFYIGGAHMARTLDERAGREALNATIAKGPYAFVTDYNGVADVGLRVPL
jgi:hypothetical protein